MSRDACSDATLTFLLSRGILSAIFSFIMRYYAKKIFLYLLNSLIYLKRALVWFGRGVGVFFRSLAKGYRSTVGLALYKVLFRLQKKINLPTLTRPSNTIEFFGRRATLQLVLFIIVVIVMIPHTKLYTKDTALIPGRETLLYSLVGPGDEIDEIEEVVAVSTPLSLPTRRDWREGAVSVEVPTAVDADALVDAQEITSISTGGRAVTKPTILPGSVLPSPSGAAAGRRTEIVYHEVQPGDTVGAIAEHYGIHVATVLWANDLSTRSYIRPGDRLTILPEDGVVHKVKRGDTVSKIAKLYGAKAQDIIEENRLKNDGSDIVIGEQLLVPGGEVPQPSRSYTPSTRRYTSLSSVAAPPPSAAAPAGSGYLWPTTVRRITQYFGWRHTGVDIGGPFGTPLYATKSGTVTKSQCGWNGGYGCYVLVDHGGGVKSLYAHASRLYVSPGERVSQGQTIAAMGSTGRSTGSHVHFEILVNGRKVNPFRYVR